MIDREEVEFSKERRGCSGSSRFWGYWPGRGLFLVHFFGDPTTVLSFLTGIKTSFSCPFFWQPGDRVDFPMSSDLLLNIFPKNIKADQFENSRLAKINPERYFGEPRNFEQSKFS